MLLNWIANKLAFLIMVSHYQQWWYIYILYICITITHWWLMFSQVRMLMIQRKPLLNPQPAVPKKTGRNVPQCWCASSMAMDKQKLLTPQPRNSSTWVISHVPMFHITQPLGINGLLDGYYFGWCPIFPKWDIYQPLFNTVEALQRTEHPEAVTKRPTNGLQHEVQVAAPTKSKICKRKLYLLVKTSWNIPSFHINMMLLLVYEYQWCPRANF